MAQDPVDPVEAIAELSRLLVSHQNMHDVRQEVVQVVLCRVRAWAPPRSLSRGANTLAPPAAMRPLAGEPDEPAVSPAARRGGVESRRHVA